MPIEVTVKQSEPRTVAFIPMKGPYDQIAATFPRLYGWVAKKGYGFIGPPIGVYYNSPQEVPAEELLWELQCPVGNHIAACKPDVSGVGVKKVAETGVASTIHKGPFDKVGETWGALYAWASQNGYEIAGPGEEIYLSDPATSPPEELMTEVRFPIKSSAS
jgi:effector-binding domain-containing protein